MSELRIAAPAVARSPPRRWKRPAIGVPGYAALMPLITVLNAVVGIALPRIIAPADFGTYALVVTLFQYGLIFDLGASQLADRRIPALLGLGKAQDAARIGQELLWLRLGIGLITLMVLAPVLAALATAGVLPFRPGLGLLSAFAGIAYMVALGPACVYRARSQRTEYALCIVVLSGGLVVARPAGLLAGGVWGCFAALALWYVAFALLFHRRMTPLRAMLPGWRAAIRLCGVGTPLFATSFLWAFYVTANRWFINGMIPRTAFGNFAFGANIFSLLVGTASGFSAFYYPRLSERIAAGGHHAVSATLQRDCLILLMAMAGVVGAGILLGGLLIGFVYPSYVPAIPVVRILLVGVPPLVLAAWLMPVSLSSGHRPWIDGLVVFPVAIAILYAAERGLCASHGVRGAACASAIGGVALVGMQLAGLWHSRILHARHAAALLAGVFATTLFLAAIALWAGAWR